MKRFFVILLLLLNAVCYGQYQHNKYVMQYVAQVHAGTAGYVISGASFNALEQTAIVWSLNGSYAGKSYQPIDTMMYCYNPLLANTAEAHKYNLYSTVNLQASFSGSPVHGYGTFTVNGTSSSAKIVGSAPRTLGVSLLGFGLTILENNAGSAGGYMGANGNCGGGSPCETSIFPRFTDGKTYCAVNGAENAGTTNATTAALFDVNRVNAASASNNVILYKDAVSFVSYNGVAASQTGFDIVIGGLATGSSSVSFSGVSFTVRDYALHKAFNANQELYFKQGHDILMSGRAAP